MTPTLKDRRRIQGLVDHVAAFGLVAGLERATRDAASIQTPAKAHARAQLLTAQGLSSLAQPFVARAVALERAEPPPADVQEL